MDVRNRLLQGNLPPRPIIVLPVAEAPQAVADAAAQTQAVETVRAEGVDSVITVKWMSKFSLHKRHGT